MKNPKRFLPYQGAVTYEDLNSAGFDAMYELMRLRPREKLEDDLHDLNILIENCEWLYKARTQKSAGQREAFGAKGDVDWSEFNLHISLIVLSAEALYEFGGLNEIRNALQRCVDTEETS